MVAFEVLRDELEVHGAPRSLVARADAARVDEIAHARMIAQLAGAFVSYPRAKDRSVRPLVDVAVENACEGCVRETFGALVGAWYARHAGSDFTKIAADEARHADLAWDVHAWIMSRLPMDERLRVAEQMRRTVEELERTIESASERLLFVELYASLWGSELAAA